MSTTTATELTDDETQRANRLLCQTPMTGLAGMPYAASVDDLLRHMDAMSDALGRSIRAEEALQQRVREYQHERHTIRKFLGTTTH